MCINTLRNNCLIIQKKTIERIPLNEQAKIMVERSKTYDRYYNLEDLLKQFEIEIDNQI